MPKKNKPKLIEFRCAPPNGEPLTLQPPEEPPPFHWTAPPKGSPIYSFVAPLNRDKETNEQIKRRVMRELYLENQKRLFLRKPMPPKINGD